MPLHLSTSYDKFVNTTTREVPCLHFFAASCRAAAGCAYRRAQTHKSDATPRADARRGRRAPPPSRRRRVRAARVRRAGAGAAAGGVSVCAGAGR